MVLTSPFNISITTFNCGRTGIDIPYFASSLHSALLPTKSPADLIVLALQEVAPLGPSFLGSGFMKWYYNRFETALHLAAKWSYTQEIQYERVLVRSVGLTGIVVYARKEVKERIKSVKAAGTGVGVWDMGNKGAVAVRLGVDEEVYTFVSAHLAPGEEQCERRNADWRKICENLVFEAVEPKAWKGEEDSSALPPTTRAGEPESEPLLRESHTQGQQYRSPSSRIQDSPIHSEPHAQGHSQPHGLFTPLPSYIFVAGDLNYRTSDTPPKKSDQENFPQPLASETSLNHHKFLFEKDQLTRELREGRTLHHLSEPPVTFPPTYKYSARAQELAAENAKTTNPSADAEGKPLVEIEEQVWLWAKHRMPSWCDRILYLSDLSPHIHSYKALPVQPTSDHRPVVMTFSLNATRLPATKPPPFEVVEGWKERRAMARRLEIFVGIGAALGFTGYGQMLVVTTLVTVVVVVFSRGGFGWA